MGGWDPRADSERTIYRAGEGLKISKWCLRLMSSIKGAEGGEKKGREGRKGRKGVWSTRWWWRPRRAGTRRITARVTKT